MSKEDDYKQQLRELGIYEPAFSAAIHDLCILERELSRTMKAWAATKGDQKSPSPDHPLYAVITEQRKTIAARRDALGLTPAGLQKLRGKPKGDGDVAGSEICRRLDALLARCRAYD